MPGSSADGPRILHVITRMNVGGAARAVLALTGHLCAEGFETLAGGAAAA